MLIKKLLLYVNYLKWYTNFIEGEGSVSGHVSEFHGVGGAEQGERARGVRARR